MKEILSKLQEVSEEVKKTSERMENVEKEIDSFKKKELVKNYGKETIAEKIKNYGQSSTEGNEEKILWKKPKKLNICETYIQEFTKLANYLNMQHPKVEELYSLMDYNKLVADIETDQRLIKSAHQHGLLHVHYIVNKDQVNIYDEGIKRAYNKLYQITKAKCIYIRFYTAFAEATPEGIIPKIEAIKLGITNEKIKYDVYKNGPIMDIIGFIRHKKALGMLTIKRELASTEGNIWIYENNNNRIIYAPSRAVKEESKKILIDWDKKISVPEATCPNCGIRNPCISEACLKVLCELSKNNLVSKHQCKNCMKKRVYTKEDFTLPEDLMELAIIEEDVSNDEITKEDKETQGPMKEK